jgi:hypothetical protein
VLHCHQSRWVVTTMSSRDSHLTLKNPLDRARTRTNRYGKNPKMKSKTVTGPGTVLKPMHTVSHDIRVGSHHMTRSMRLRRTARIGP